jgi:hypothetical protein
MPSCDVGKPVTEETINKDTIVLLSGRLRRLIVTVMQISTEKGTENTRRHDARLYDALF